MSATVAAIHEPWCHWHAWTTGACHPACPNLPCNMSCWHITDTTGQPTECDGWDDPDGRHMHPIELCGDCGLEGHMPGGTRCPKETS